MLNSTTLCSLKIPPNNTFTQDYGIALIVSGFLYWTLLTLLQSRWIKRNFNGLTCQIQRRFYSRVRKNDAVFKISKIFTITLYKKTLFRFTMMDPLMKRMMKTKKSVENARELTLKLMPNLRLQFEVFTSTTENLRQSEISLSAWIYKRLSDFLVFFHFI
jgi:hypothetical protein